MIVRCVCCEMAVDVLFNPHAAFILRIYTPCLEKKRANFVQGKSSEVRK